MQLETVTSVDAGHFTYCAASQTLITDHSDLGNPNFGLLYDDAIDQGFELFNRRTGSRTRWYLSNTAIEHGEVIYWLFKPTDETVRVYPSTHNHQIKVFND